MGERLAAAVHPVEPPQDCRSRASGFAAVGFFPLGKTTAALPHRHAAVNNTNCRRTACCALAQPL